MITAEELVSELNTSEEQKSFKLATVTALFANQTAKLKFDGEDIASEKQYAYLTSYSPQLNDRVLLCLVGGTYIILGKISYNVAPSGQLDGEISAIKGDISTINGKINTINGNISTINGNISTVNGNINTINDALQYKITSNMVEDVNGNRNIDYMYVDPTNGWLRVRRKNGVWTRYIPTA